MSVIHDTVRIPSTGLIGIGNIRRIGKYPFFSDSRFYVAIPLHPSAPCGSLRGDRLFASQAPRCPLSRALPFWLSNSPVPFSAPRQGPTWPEFRQGNLRNYERKKLKETELVTKWAVQIEQKPITGKKASQNNRALINYKTGPIKWMIDSFLDNSSSELLILSQ